MHHGSAPQSQAVLSCLNLDPSPVSQIPLMCLRPFSCVSGPLSYVSDPLLCLRSPSCVSVPSPVSQIPLLCISPLSCVSDPPPVYQSPLLCLRSPLLCLRPLSCFLDLSPVSQSPLLCLRPLSCVSDPPRVSQTPRLCPRPLVCILVSGEPHLSFLAKQNNISHCFYQDLKNVQRYRSKVWDHLETSLFL